ncbi:hypothetical protein RB4645 [Rhodopirellula baltica SH 1]|uniref:Uncharacterized protein n=1 Tax=Rhodopirellula baltica (strain DSM 10527 / NCIMB 13988 / SH1) TaxID=243090 RepID=Q7US89_RHOBA|nr:hypothetical protein RB4645 [Rhodopirellula baltica SH 1]
MLRRVFSTPAHSLSWRKSVGWYSQHEQPRNRQRPSVGKTDPHVADMRLFVFSCLLGRSIACSVWCAQAD